jgi:hypothetical protein
MFYMKHPEFFKNYVLCFIFSQTIPFEYILPSISHETPNSLPNLLLKFKISAQESIWVIF